MNKPHIAKPKHQQSSRNNIFSWASPKCCDPPCEMISPLNKPEMKTVCFLLLFSVMVCSFIENKPRGLDPVAK